MSRQDPNLYGQRPVKKPKKEIPLPSSLNFTSQLTSLLSSASSSSSTTTVAPGRVRPAKQKDDIFSASNRKRKADRPGRDGGRNDSGDKLSLKSPNGTEEEKADFLRSKRRMEEKARLYNAMKRGDYIPSEHDSAAPLVDFDRKWAEKHPEGGAAGAYSSSGEDNASHSEGGDDDDDDDDDNIDRELVDWQDEYGRTRRGTRAERERYERRQRRGQLGADELERMSARPRAPATEKLIYGDAIQTAAFNPEADTAAQMQDLAAKRDNTPTPPPEVHFDATREVRTKGTGFYQFSQESAQREEQMRNLEAERENTEKVRKGREAERERRRREIEERRKAIGVKRAERLAGNFLDGLAAEMGTEGGSNASEGKKPDNGDKE